VDGVRSAQLLAGAGLGAAGIAAVAVALLAGGGPAFVPIAIVAVIGAMSTVLVLWFRQRPVAPDDPSMYLQTVVMKLAAAEVPVLIAVVLAVVLGPGWVSLVGYLLTLGLVWWLWPSESDRERHHLLYLA
jgi:hypothetical protein